MRLIDADHLTFLVNDSTILGNGFKQAFTAIVNGEPTIEPERKMGKWVKAERDGVIVYSDAYAQCSMCKEVTFLGWEMKFCPNCGADMRGDENETN